MQPQIYFTRMPLNTQTDFGSSFSKRSNLAIPEPNFNLRIKFFLHIKLLVKEEVKKNYYLVTF